MDSTDRLGQQRGHRKHKDIVELLLGGQGDGVGNHQTLDRSFFDRLNRSTAQDSVGRGQVNLLGAGFMDKFGCPADRTACADHVIEHQTNLPLDRTTDDVPLLGLKRIVSDFIDNGEFATDALGVPKGPFDATFIRADHDDVLGVQILVLEIPRQGRSCIQMVDRHVKKALDLRGVQVHCQDPIGTGSGDQIRNQLGRDRSATLVLAVLACIAVVWNHRSDPCCTGTLA